MTRAYRWVVSVALLNSACSAKEQKSENDPRGGTPLQEREVAVPPARISSSSAHGPSAGYTFVAANLTDGAITTSWQPAKSDKGPHWVRLEFDDDVTVTSVAIANGFQTTDRYGDEFLLNRKIATGRLRFGSSGEVPVQFAADAREHVRFAIPRKVTRTVELIVESTHPGSKWNDLAVSEIEVTGIVKHAEVVVAQASRPASSVEEWWTPPPGDRKEIEALAHGFAGLDENDLGTVFTSELKPVHGAPNLFERKPPRRVPRDEMQHVAVKLRQSEQLDAGFRYLVLQAGANYKSQRDYQVRRAMQVKEIVRIDDTARMRRPPEEAVFYLAEVHRGASFDLLVEGDYSSMGAQLDLLFAKGDAALKNVKTSSSYRLKAFGLGLSDVSGRGIFSLTPQEIASRYRVGSPVPVQLVFRAVPGRKYEPKKLPIPETVIDDAMFRVDESSYRSWSVPPGRYWLEATSQPNGMKLKWEGDVACDQRQKTGEEYRLIKMSCTVSGQAQLQLENPSLLRMGAPETMSLYLAKQR